MFFAPDHKFIDTWSCVKGTGNLSLITVTAKVAFKLGCGTHFINTQRNKILNTTKEMQFFLPFIGKQGQIYSGPVADSWAGAVMQKPFRIQKCDGSTDGPTDMAGCRVHVRD